MVSCEHFCGLPCCEHFSLDHTCCERFCGLPCCERFSRDHTCWEHSNKTAPQISEGLFERCLAESNRCSRFCRPVPNRSAKAPFGIANVGILFGLPKYLWQNLSICAFGCIVCSTIFWSLCSMGLRKPLCRKNIRTFAGQGNLPGVFLS